MITITIADNNKQPGPQIKLFSSDSWFCCRPYYLLIQARKSFRELLVTAIVDTPPEQGDVLVRRGPGFVIQRMGEPGV